MLHEAFRKVRDGVKRILPLDKQQKFEEYFYVVSYHLGFALEAEQICKFTLLNTIHQDSPGSYSRLLFDSNKNNIYLHDFRPGDLLRYGDIALREAHSAIDAGLLLTNYLLNLGIDQTTLSWKSENKKRSLRTQLLEGQLSNVSKNLVTVMDGIWDSMGYHLLKEYRNWVTHRGAPKLLAPSNIAGPIPIPQDILKESNSFKQHSLLRDHILTFLNDSLQIQCFPFHPMAMSIVNEDIQNSNKDINIAGTVHIAQGASVVIKDLTIISCLHESEDEFLKKSAENVERDRINVAGEKLAIYKARDYIGAVGDMVSFAKQTLQQSWDMELAALCEANWKT